MTSEHARARFAEDWKDGHYEVKARPSTTSFFRCSALPAVALPASRSLSSALAPLTTVLFRLGMEDWLSARIERLSPQGDKESPYVVGELLWMLNTARQGIHDFAEAALSGATELQIAERAFEAIYETCLDQ